MIPQTLITRFGEPEVHGRWASWTHCTKGYRTLLFNLDSGWLTCQSCGIRERVVKVDPGNSMARVWQVRPSIPPNPDTWGQPTRDARAYALRRGMTPLEIDTLCVSCSKYPGYLVFPVEEDGFVVSWQGRAIYGQDPRWVSAPSREGWIPTRYTVWGLDRIRPKAPVYLCEGIFSALYFETGVALLGIEPTQRQVVKILDRCPGTIVICPDNPSDKSGSLAPGQWWSKINTIDRTHPVEVMTSPGKDWGEEVEQRRRHQ